jgi:hypothetical protein
MYKGPSELAHVLFAQCLANCQPSSVTAYPDAVMQTPRKKPTAGCGGNDHKTTGYVDVVVYLIRVLS